MDDKPSWHTYVSLKNSSSEKIKQFYYNLQLEMSAGLEAVERRAGAGLSRSNVDEIVSNGGCEEMHSHRAIVRAGRRLGKAHDVAGSRAAGKQVNEAAGT